MVSIYARNESVNAWKLRSKDTIDSRFRFPRSFVNLSLLVRMKLKQSDPSAETPPSGLASWSSNFLPSLLFGTQPGFIVAYDGWSRSYEKMMKGKYVTQIKKVWKVIVFLDSIVTGSLFSLSHLLHPFSRPLCLFFRRCGWHFYAGIREYRHALRSCGFFFLCMPCWVPVYYM